jgi:hypothetical protein
MEKSKSTLHCIAYSDDAPPMCCFILCQSLIHRYHKPGARQLTGRIHRNYFSHPPPPTGTYDYD